MAQVTASTALRKLQQRAIAHELDHAAAMARDGRVDDGSAQ